MSPSALTRTVLAGLLAGALAVGSGSCTRECTEIGCQDTLELRMATQAAWWPPTSESPVSVSVTVAGATGTVTCPGGSSTGDLHVECFPGQPPELRVSAGPEGPMGQAGPLQGTARFEGEAVGSPPFVVEFEASVARVMTPNGPDCEPSCNVREAALVIE